MKDLRKEKELLRKEKERSTAFEKKADELQATVDDLRQQLLRTESPGTSDNEYVVHANTPQTTRSRVATLTRNFKIEHVKRQLTGYFSLLEGVRNALTDNPSVTRPIVDGILQSTPIRTNRSKSMLIRELQISTRAGRRKQPTRYISKRKKRADRTAAAVIETVLDFFNRDDNSRILPGKADCVSLPNENEERERVQKRVCTQYLYSLYEKYKIENLNTILGLTTFMKIRHDQCKHIQVATYLEAQTCLCNKHQNTALLLKSMIKWCPNDEIPTCPDSFILKYTTEEFVNIVTALGAPPTVDSDGATPATTTPTTTETDTDGNMYSFFEWAREYCEKRLMKCMQKLERFVTLKKYKEKLLKQNDMFRIHHHRVHTQYREIKNIKIKLREGEVLVQMDFSENFQCSEASEEVQSAHYNKPKVTLHPMVVYWRPAGSDNIKHKSIVAVSQVDHHDTDMVVCILKKFLLEELPNIVDHMEIKRIHYVTDSPSSQYRNKGIFLLVVHHKLLFGMDATWHLLETGHGKGPCDGIGGTVKRSADEAIAQGVVIKDARTFYEWAIGTRGLISYFYIEQDQYDAAVEEMQAVKPLLRVVPKTLDIHSVMSDINIPGNVISRETSCSCDGCFSGTPPEECAWSSTKILKRNCILPKPCNHCPGFLCHCLLSTST